MKYDFIDHFNYFNENNGFQLKLSLFINDFPKPKKKKKKKNIYIYIYIYIYNY